jgi:hypothetical protein
MSRDIHHALIMTFVARGRIAVIALDRHLTARVSLL